MTHHSSPTFAPQSCPFCEFETRQLTLENNLAFAIYDLFPVTPLHMLIIPKRHVCDYFDMTQKELAACEKLVREGRKVILEQDQTVAGFNIGINIGASAGQSIFHCHIHLIPRRTEDTPHPRGGVRGVIAGKQAY